MKQWLVACAVVAAVVLPGGAGLAEAGGGRAPRDVSPWQAPHVSPWHPAPRHPHSTHAHRKRVQRFLRPRTHVIIAPAPVLVAPRCWVPGHWSYQWVPRTATYPVWVPGHWAGDGTWVDGHYQSQLYTSGFYQPYWVDGHHTSC